MLSLLRNSAAGAAEFSGRKQPIATLDAAWIPSARATKAREAIPRPAGPTVTIKEQSDKRWSVYVRLEDGRQGRSTCKTEKDAKDRAKDFLAGVDMKQPGAADAASPVSRKSGRNHSDPTPPAKRVSTNYVPGPGRGRHTPVTQASHALAALKKQLVLDFAEGILSPDIKDIDEMFHVALEQIYEHSNNLSMGSLFTATNTLIACQRREKSVPSASKRTAQRHRAAILHTLTETVGSDPTKQIELASSVLNVLQKRPVQPSARVSRAEQNELRAQKFIVCSLRHALRTLRHRHIGRYTHSDRVLQQSILSSASCKLPAGTLAAAARILDTDERDLALAQSRWEEYEAGERTVFDEAEKAATPYQYVEFVREQWLERTRESERMRDEIRNPNDKSDPILYRVHYQEDRTIDLLDDVFEAGVFKYGSDNFTLSERTFRKLKPFQIRKSRDESCVCVHHLKWAKMVVSYFKQRRQLKLPAEEKCTCNLKLTPGDRIIWNYCWRSHYLGY